MTQQSLTFLAQTQPGFEAITGEMLAELPGRTRLRATYVVGDRNGLALFDYAGDPADLIALRSIEDLFVLVAHLPALPPDREGLRRLEAAARAAELGRALALARSVTAGRGRRGGMRFRVVSRLVGHASYRRIDAQRAVERGIAARSDHRWRLEEEAGVEFWLTLLPGEALLGLRLTDARTRHRAEKREHLPASLRPAAAAALVYLTRPAPGDLFLDPMCGAGTILIERAHAERYQLLLGGDIRPEALEVARANIGPRYKPIELRQWDARTLPIDAASVSAVAVNLPFGRQVGSPEENRSLYPAFLHEIARVVRAGGRVVALTGDTRTFDDALRRARSLRLVRGIPVTVLGQRARIYVIDRT